MVNTKGRRRDFLSPQGKEYSQNVIINKRGLREIKNILKGNFIKIC